MSQKRIILVVDDNSITRLTHQNLLQHLGYEVVVAESDQVLNAICLDEYSVIFMDVNMPKINGIELTRKIRSLESGGEPILIFGVTTDDSKMTKQACLAAGMNKIIIKPLSMTILSELLLT